MFLTEVKRQTDQLFINILTEIRKGNCPDWVEKKLMATSSQVIAKDGIVPTKLCTHKADVEIKNTENLELLPGNSIEFRAVDSIPAKSEMISKGCLAEPLLTLKIGAQVMLIKNIEVSAGLANGSRGVVIKFENRLPVVKFLCGKTMQIGWETFNLSFTNSGTQLVVTRKQLPLKLAYAISVHKSQGMTLDCVDLYLSRTFEKGQAYVALSRCKSLASMRVIDWNKNCVMADKTVKEFYKKYQQLGDHY